MLQESDSEVDAAMDRVRQIGFDAFASNIEGGERTACPSFVTASTADRIPDTHAVV